MVRLNGFATSDAGKLQAESIAKSIAIGEGVLNQIVIVTPDDNDNTNNRKVVNFGKGIGEGLDTTLAGPSRYMQSARINLLCRDRCFRRLKLFRE